MLGAVVRQCGVCRSMKKRRRLADRMIMGMCAVFIAVSTFFYSPMVVSAEDIGFSGSAVIDDYELITADDAQYSSEVSENLFSTADPYISMQYYIRTFNSDLGSIDFSPYVTQQSSLYKVTFDLDYEFLFRPSGSAVFYLANIAIFENNESTLLYLPTVYADRDNIGSYSITTYLTSSQLLKNYKYSFLAYSTTRGTQYLDISLSFNNIVVEPVSTSGSNEYQNGYNAGYLAGESAGYGNGYSDGFADGEASVDMDSIYDEAFQAGKDSVDTDSYYDAGYNAGYQAGVNESYDIGYRAGYDSAMERVDSWGADTSDYPVYITSSSSSFGFLGGYVYGNSQVYDEEIIALNFDINPNHIYRFDVKLGTPQQASYSNVYGSYTAVYFCAGGVDYFISPTLNLGEGTYDSIYVRGDILSSSFSKKGVVNVVSSSVTNPDMAASFSFNNFWHDVKVYDVGPIGNMQNHIANQTDQLTSGYDDSKGNSVNSNLSTGLNEYQTAEDSLFATATSGLQDFTFFDFASVPAMITGMSFITSIMGSWFTHAGGASGVGIVLSILFSVMLVAMVLGLYRWYQSRGGKK